MTRVAEVGTKSSVDHAPWLRSTPVIDAEHPEIRALALQLERGRASARERALAAFAFVSEDIRFGFTPKFYRMRASQVLQARVGYCNTQASLFIALLRAMGVPARPHMVDIDARVLQGVLQPGSPFVDHTYSEVLLDGRWVKVDAYIVDPPLLRAAKAKLRREGGVLGYGAHRDGTCAWDGRSDAFSQFLVQPLGPAISTRDYGVFDDVEAFYAAPGARWNKLNLITSIAIGAFAADANRRIDRLRHEAA